jgi:Domain of unknown function (DUF5047)
LGGEWLMYPSSSNFSQALQGDHNVIIKVQVYQPGGFYPIFDSTTPGCPAYITDGTVTFQKQSDARSQLSITIVNPDGTLIPQLPSDIFTPWGNEMWVYWGIDYEGSLPNEFIPLGRFRISQNQIAEKSGTPTMMITGYDRSRNISRNVVLNSWPTSVSTSQGDMSPLQQLIWNKPFSNLIQVACRDRYPAVRFSGDLAEWAQYESDPPLLQDGLYVGAVIAEGFAAFSQGTDMWNQSRQYAAACGCDLFFDRNGVCTFYRDPSFNNMSAAVTPVPVATFIEGSTAIFDQITRTLDDGAAYNGTVVYGGGNTQVQSLVSFNPNYVNQFGPGSVVNITPYIDNDPSSPTYWYGPYGQVPHIITNNLLVTQTQVNNYAQLMLIIDLGSQEACAIPSMAIDPRVDIDDVVLIDRSRLGLDDALYIVDSLTIPLAMTSNGQMTLRQRRALI